MKMGRWYKKKITKTNINSVIIPVMVLLLIGSVFIINDLHKKIALEKLKAVKYYDVAYSQCNIDTIQIDNDDSIIIDGSRIENVEILQTKDGNNRTFTLNHNYIEKITYCPTAKDTKIKELNCISSAIITPNIPKETVKTIEALLCKNAQVMYLNTREGAPYAN